MVRMVALVLVSVVFVAFMRVVVLVIVAGKKKDNIDPGDNGIGRVSSVETN